ncbi:hypothetical protein FRACYDRAFT_247869 [Fragilariopsis cylindrus CCMP1102]|uniref:Uncharacterized protein n=1 Tax=Fragilariopsis cylindrus CCMP1102 TaxID=635003 RepID=A0A1E7EWS0_9STRA|nr:hypothetical protein FRACYDRAFT_247869 [Fragilariopsis cylindrus CCMP1102]|eukprot:OEU10254.1 hypothetical protein FRACYDRAFT_247869 [Fragilariopsis cylindrus CCMP1102]
MKAKSIPMTPTERKRKSRLNPDVRERERERDTIRNQNRIETRMPPGIPSIAAPHAESQNERADTNNHSLELAKLSQKMVEKTVEHNAKLSQKTVEHNTKVTSQGLENINNVIRRGDPSRNSGDTVESDSNTEPSLCEENVAERDGVSVKSSHDGYLDDSISDQNDDRNALGDEQERQEKEGPRLERTEREEEEEESIDMNRPVEWEQHDSAIHNDNDDDDDEFISSNEDNQDLSLTEHAHARGFERGIHRSVMIDVRKNGKVVTTPDPKHPNTVKYIYDGIVLVVDKATQTRAATVWHMDKSRDMYGLKPPKPQCCSSENEPSVRYWADMEAYNIGRVAYKNLLLHVDIEYYREKHRNAQNDIYYEKNRAEDYKSKFLAVRSQLLQNGNEEANEPRKRRRDSGENGYLNEPRKRRRDSGENEYLNEPRNCRRDSRGY